MQDFRCNLFVFIPGNDSYMIKLCFRLLTRGGVSRVPCVVAAENRNDLIPHEADKFFSRVMSSSSGLDLVNLCGELSKYIKEGSFGIEQECEIMKHLVRLSVRHESVLEACLWRIFKHPVFPRQTGLGEILGKHTSFAFRVMAEQRLVNDPQLITLGLGRCIELGEFMTLKDLGEVYRALYTLNLQHFTIAENHFSSGCRFLRPGQPWSTSTTYREDFPTDQQLINQPNLIDILSLSLEEQLRQLTPSVEHSKKGLMIAENHNSSTSLCDEVLAILRGLSFLGLHHGETFSHLELLCCNFPNSPPVSYFTLALLHAMNIHARPLDLLRHEDRYPDVEEQKKYLIIRIAEQFMSTENLFEKLQQDCESVLRLRKLFESSDLLYNSVPCLWDVARSMPIKPHIAKKLDIRSKSNGASRAPSQENGICRQGKLFHPRHSVKLNKITESLNEIERGIPPQFKTWRSPLDTRGERSASPGIRKKFGVRRVTSNYIVEKRKKYSPAVWAK